jgi:hypothetical protein
LGDFLVKPILTYDYSITIFDEIVFYNHNIDPLFALQIQELFRDGSFADDEEHIINNSVDEDRSVSNAVDDLEQEIQRESNIVRA